MKILCKSVWAILFLFFMVSAIVAAPQAGIVAARAIPPPAINGILDDPCWQTATPLEPFGVNGTTQSPPVPMQGRVCFDDGALYVAVTCGTPDPALLKANSKTDGPEVWRDDCVELFINTSGLSTQCDQFIVNSLGARQCVRRRDGRRVEGWAPGWSAGATVGDNKYVVEMKIPFSALDYRGPINRGSVGLKVGREDRTGKDVQLIGWPAGQPYGTGGEWGQVIFGTTNIIDNANFLQGIAVSWMGDNGGGHAFIPELEYGVGVIHVKTGGMGKTLSQNISVEKDRIYKLSVKAKGTGGTSFRILCGPQTVAFRTVPSVDYRTFQAVFDSGDNVGVKLVWGFDNGPMAGDVWLKDFQLVPAGRVEARGPAISLRRGEPLAVKKVMVKEARVLRGLDLAPVDGTIETRTWDSKVYEYGDRGNYGGVEHVYKGNNGCHITLADADGVDAVLIRKGAACKMYADCPRYDTPEGGKLIQTFPGRTMNSRALFPQRVKSSRFSFFDVTDGYLGNVSFFRIGTASAQGAVDFWNVGEAASVSGDIAQNIGHRFDARDMVYAIGQGVAPSAVQAKAGASFHLVGKPFEAETCLDGVTVQFSLDAKTTNIPLTLTVQDPINPRRELIGADFELPGSGNYSVYLDFYNQVIPRGKALWLTMQFGENVKLQNARMMLAPMPREKALPEALAWNKLLMLAQFIPLSEPRPWTAMRETREQPHIEDYLAWARTVKTYSDQLVELFQTIDYCRSLAPEDRIPREMYDWVHQKRLNLDKSLPPVTLKRTAGAPEWADALQQAYLAVRSVPEWWLDNRLVPTGEMGGGINDDTDMYQNWGDFALYEEGGVGAQLLSACRDLAQLIETRGFAKDTGVPARSNDPLHFYEDGINQMALMTWMDYGNPIYVEQAMLAARTTEIGLTTVVRGTARHFKSQEMGSEDLQRERKLGEDGKWHFLLLQPSLMTVWYNDNPRAAKLIRECADTWLPYYQPGKYAHIVDVATGEVKDTRAAFPPGQSGVQILTAYLLKDAKYAQPLQEQAEASASWAENDLSKGLNWNLIRVNDAVKANARQAGGYVDFAVNGNKAALIADLKHVIAHLTAYRNYYTTFEPFTDRLFMKDLTQPVSTAYLGGSYSRNIFANDHAVSWKGFGTDYAALCLRARPDGIKFLVYSFADKPMNGTMTVWSLEHGRYKVITGIDADGNDNMDKADNEQLVELYRGVPVSVALAPRQITVIEVTRQEVLPDVRSRADLALSPSEVRLEGDAVIAVVHNIGSAPAEVVVALVDKHGNILSSAPFGVLEAPLDLTPRRVRVRLTGLPKDWTGGTLVVDPNNKVPEIYEGNNRAGVPPAARR